MGDERNSDLSSTGSGPRRFQMKQSKRQFSKQYQLAGAGGYPARNRAPRAPGKARRNTGEHWGCVSAACSRANRVFWLSRAWSGGPTGAGAETPAEAAGSLRGEQPSGLVSRRRVRAQPHLHFRCRLAASSRCPYPFCVQSFSGPGRGNLTDDRLHKAGTVRYACWRLSQGCRRWCDRPSFRVTSAALPCVRPPRVAEGRGRASIRTPLPPDRTLE